MSYTLAKILFIPGMLEEEAERETLTLKFIACAIVYLVVYLVAGCNNAREPFIYYQAMM